MRSFYEPIDREKVLQDLKILEIKFEQLTGVKEQDLSLLTKAHRRLAMKWHPDKNLPTPNEPNKAQIANDKMKEINPAKDSLSAVFDKPDYLSELNHSQPYGASSNSGGNWNPFSFHQGYGKDRSSNFQKFRGSSPFKFPYESSDFSSSNTSEDYFANYFQHLFSRMREKSNPYHSRGPNEFSSNNHQNASNLAEFLRKKREEEALNKQAENLLKQKQAAELLKKEQQDYEFKAKQKQLNQKKIEAFKLFTSTLIDSLNKFIISINTLKFPKETEDLPTIKKDEDKELANINKHIDEQSSNLQRLKLQGDIKLGRLKRWSWLKYTLILYFIPFFLQKSLDKTEKNAVQIQSHLNDLLEKKKVREEEIDNLILAAENKKPILIGGKTIKEIEREFVFSKMKTEMERTILFAEKFSQDCEENPGKIHTRGTLVNSKTYIEEIETTYKDGLKHLNHAKQLVNDTFLPSIPDIEDKVNFDNFKTEFEKIRIDSAHEPKDDVNDFRYRM